MASQPPPAAQQPGQPTEEQMRAYLEQLREADPTEVVVQAYTMLGTGAEVKLGRPDARVLIDVLGSLVEGAEGRVPLELHARMREGVGQLQMAQVQAEREAGASPADQPAGTAEQPAPGQPAGTTAEQHAPGQRAGAPPPAGAPPGGEPSRGEQRMTDRLWVPGRDPRPRPR